MKLSRHIVLLLLFVTLNLLVLNRANAQTDTQQNMRARLKAMTPRQRADFQTKMMTEKLKLNSRQVTSVETVNLKYALKAEPIIKSDDGRFSKFRKFKALQEDKDAELKAIFTPAQFTLYQDFEQEMRQKLKEANNSSI